MKLSHYLAAFCYAALIGLLLLGCSKPEDNYAPVIQSLTAYPAEVTSSGQTNITVIATDENVDDLSYYWACRTGTLLDRSGPEATWEAPDVAGTYYVSVTVSDVEFVATDSVAVSVISVPPNTPPTVPYHPSPVDYANSIPLATALSWYCIDSDGDSLKFDVSFALDGGFTSLIFVRRDLVEFHTDVANLTRNTSYYWRVVVRDEHGSERNGATWTFKTG